MKTLQKIAVFAALLSGSLVTLAPANLVSAGPFDASKSQACRGANLSNSDTNCHADSSRETLDRRIQFIVNLLTAIIGIVAVILIIINGLRFITSNGDSNSISSAKNGVIYAIVGLIIVALAQIIVRFVLART
jgi:hypothetical protein